MTLSLTVDAESRHWQPRIATLAPDEAVRLARRARTAPLFAHAYAFHLNFRFGGMVPADLLAHAAAQGLVGVQIHVEDGEAASLAAMDGADLAAFGAEARRLDWQCMWKPRQPKPGTWRGPLPSRMRWVPPRCAAIPAMRAAFRR